MKILVSDLDNTLIYSYKKEIGPEKVLVETYQEKELSYMTETSYRLLSELRSKLLFVPMSTRSVAQYKRITFNENWRPRIALVSNGGTLLLDGKEDPVWKWESYRLIEPSMKELEKAEHVLEKDPNRTLDVRRVDEVFVFTKSSKSDETLHLLTEKLDLTLVDCYKNGSKVYVLPKVLTKGNAIERLKRLCKADVLFVAGDSLFDVSMLEQADLAYCPKELEGAVSNKKGKLRTVSEGEVLSDIMLQEIYEELFEK